MRNLGISEFENSLMKLNQWECGIEAIKSTRIQDWKVVHLVIHTFDCLYQLCTYDWKNPRLGVPVRVYLM